MSEISQLKTVNGEYSGLADSALRDVSGTFLTAVPEGYATTADITGKQDKLTFGYNASNAISSINNSALAGEGGGGGGTSYTFTAPLYDDNGTVSLSTSYGSFSSYQATANCNFNVEIKSLNGESSYGYGIEFSKITTYPATISVDIFPDSSFTAVGASHTAYIYPLIMDELPAEFVSPENIWYIPQRILFGSQIDPPYAYTIYQNISVITQSGRSDSPIRLEGENDFTNYPYLAFGVFSEENPTSTASLIGIYGANSATHCTGLIGKKYLDISLDSRFNKNNDGVITGYQGSGIGGTFDNIYNTVNINGIPTILTNGTGTKNVPYSLHSDYTARISQSYYTGRNYYPISSVATSACLSHDVPYDITARFLTGGANPAFTAKLKKDIDNIVTGMEPNYGYYVEVIYPDTGYTDYTLNISSDLVSSVELSGIVIPDTSDFVPNSSYTAATAELNELKNIISTYSGQWVSP